MSYSISVRALTVTAAALAVSAKLDETAEQQPIHESDKAQALAVTEAFLALVRAPGEGEEVSVTVSGWLSKRRAEDEGLIGASVSVQASIVDQIAAPLTASG